ncbi:uncharacterized protein LOC103570689 [Microplitis demolitor]|uniref:uncharacterized protein LOC103570689 n=1 Tax=Microplitis demolitor TaxID=69319 RepID=UPI0004CCA1FA|nr:uncharacterized protein LOC103570689 [Microplitis demolitor]
MGLKCKSLIIRLIVLIFCLTLLIADVKSIPNPANQVKGLVNIINGITTLVTGMNGLIELIKNDDSDQVFQNEVTGKLDDIYNACLKIDQVKDQVKNLTSVMNANAIRVILETALREDMNYMLEINNKLNIIETRYRNDFSSIYAQIKNYCHDSVDTYISSIIDGDDLKDKLTDILKATELAGKNSYARKNIFEIAVAYSRNEKNYHRDCNDISAYDKLYSFYEYVLGTVTQGYTMIILAYQYRKLKSTDPNFYRDRQLEYLNIYKQSVIKITESIQYHLSNNNDINFKSSISCDPQLWKEGENYIRIKNYASVRTQSTPDDNFIPDRRGIEYECAHYAEWRDLAVPELIATKHCPHVFIPNHYRSNCSSTFSEFMDYASRGEDKKCVLGTYPGLREHCLCDESSDPIFSVRKLSLLLQSCSTDRNEVVTNTRFHVQDGIISIEIQCGTFVNGKVDPDTLRWNTDDRSYTRENHPNYAVLSETLRSFNMDDILLPDGEFVTGVKFEKLDDNYFSLVIQGTEMYDSNNLISIGQTSLRYPQNSEVARISIDLMDLITPLEIKEQTYEMSESGSHYVGLTRSGWSDTYGSHATIPFLDMQPIDLSPAVPLGGLGLFYKSQPDYGGFLAFKHISPKFMHFISEDYVDKLTIISPGA